MSPEQKEELSRIKNLKIREDIPDDLRIAIQTFLKQAAIVGEYDLPHMPPEYMKNLLQIISKYPEHNMLTLSLIEILKKDDLIWLDIKVYILFIYRKEFFNFLTE